VVYEDENWKLLTIPECGMLLSIGVLRRVIILTADVCVGMGCGAANKELWDWYRR